MAYEEILPRRGIARADMLRRVARFAELKGSDGGLPDSKAPECERTLYNVIGFQPPEGEGEGVQSPGGRGRGAHVGDPDLGRDSTWAIAAPNPARGR